MGLAYGTEIKSFQGVPILGQAKKDALERLKKIGVGSEDVLWRVESVIYSTCTVEVCGSETYGSTSPRLELFPIEVFNWTPKGATLNLWSGARRRWVGLDGHHAKQYASRTPEEALTQFVRRKLNQRSIIMRQLERVEKDLRLSGARK